MSISVSQSSSNALFCPQPKYIQFTVIEEEINQNTFTFKKLDSNRFIDY